jgi:hypothetical protein
MKISMQMLVISKTKTEKISLLLIKKVINSPYEDQVNKNNLLYTWLQLFIKFIDLIYYFN